MNIRAASDWLANVTIGYIDCALWSETYFCAKCGEAGTVVDECEAGEDLHCGKSLKDNGLSWSDLTREAENDAESDVVDFVMSNWGDLSDLDPEQVGHDFWLTRNGHGVGFWDRGLGERGDRLTEACRPYGEVSLYLGDDGKIYYQG